MSAFEDMVSAVVDGGMSESAVIDYYHLIAYPYNQTDRSCCPQAGIEGEMARTSLLRHSYRFTERSWVMHNKGAKPHYKGD